MTPEVALAPRSWWSRNWKWFLPTIIIVPPLLCCGVGALILNTGMKAIRTSAPFTMALDEVRRSPEVVARLGEPIEQSGWRFDGKIENNEAILNFPIEGPKGTANVSTQSRQVGKEWGLTRLEVDINGERLNLMKQVMDRDGSDTPKFDPNAKHSDPNIEDPGMEVDIKLPEPGDVEIKLPE